MAETILQLHDTSISVTNKINLSCDKGTISQYSAVKTGNLISLAFVLTTTSEIASNAVGVIVPTFSEEKLKPIQRSEIGGSHDPRIIMFLTSDVTYRFEFVTNANISSGAAFWLQFMYICNN